jgi:hypothetical protein
LEPPKQFRSLFEQVSEEDRKAKIRADAEERRRIAERMRKRR